MFEMMIKNEELNLNNKQLKQATNRILKMGMTIQKSAFKIADELYSIKVNGLYKDDGFKNITDYAKKVLKEIVTSPEKSAKVPVPTIPPFPAKLAQFPKAETPLSTNVGVVPTVVKSCETSPVPPYKASLKCNNKLGFLLNII